MTSNNNSKKHWFALKVFYNKVFAIEELLLKKKIKCYIPCEHVKVIDGTFKGAEGYICRIKKNHRLIITVHGVCAVATSYIPQAFLKKIP